MKKGIVGGILVAIGAIGGYLYANSPRGPKKYSWKWIESLSNHDWEKEREIVRKDICKPGISQPDYYYFKRILDRFDKVKSVRDWAGKEPGFPVSRENGWYLPHKD